MKNYEIYELEDFVGDDAFIAWCLQPNEERDQFWMAFLEKNPEQTVKIQEARELIHDLYAIEQEEQDEQFETTIWNNIEQTISEESKSTKVRQLIRWVAASAAILLLGVGSYWVLAWSDNNVTSLTTQSWINYENTTGLTKLIQLPDKSTVELEPFSSLKYPTAFTNDQRSVFLTGEAFFDIERDTTKPFLVYANETITKVLGTSFRIIAFEGQKTVEVEVNSGKVAVYAKVASEKKEQKRLVVETDEKIYFPLPNKKLEVRPNQKVVFDRKEKNLVKTLATLPKLIKSIEELPQLSFQNEPITKVFASLEKVYGIEIKYDDDALKNCLINTHLTDEPLFEKLSILCAALNLEFKEIDAAIYISGEGC